LHIDLLLVKRLADPAHPINAGARRFSLLCRLSLNCKDLVRQGQGEIARLTAGMRRCRGSRLRKGANSVNASL
jgi:hypothetical protein